MDFFSRFFGFLRNFGIFFRDFKFFFLAFVIFSGIFFVIFPQSDQDFFWPFCPSVWVRKRFEIRDSSALSFIPTHRNIKRGNSLTDTGISKILFFGRVCSEICQGYFWYLHFCDIHPRWIFRHWLNFIWSIFISTYSILFKSNYLLVRSNKLFASVGFDFIPVRTFRNSMHGWVWYFLWLSSWGLQPSLLCCSKNRFGTEINRQNRENEEEIFHTLKGGEISILARNRIFSSVW